MIATIHSILARIRAVFRQGNDDNDFDQELQTHLAMSEADKIRSGMSRGQARRAARLELGGLTQLKEAGREARGLPWLDAFWLDFKLGVRMLRKSWGLTLVGGLAMTVVIFIAGFAFQIFHTIQGRSLPLDDGDSIVALIAWDPAGNVQRGVRETDIERWRASLQSVEEIGAFRTIERSLLSEDGPAEPVAVAEITAAGFQVPRVPPLLGRPLIEEDEQVGAEPVVVIGYHLWHSRFLADPAILGRQVALGGTPHTIVGVMPEEFAFPVSHGIWTPLRLDSAPGRATPLFAFGRLAPDATLDSAQAELATVGFLPATTATTGTTTEAQGELPIQPRVVPYAYGFIGALGTGEGRWTVRIVLFFISLVLLPPCANIAILIYARTVTRQTEFAARTALGASRRRIVGQIFIEVLVLAGSAAVVALVLAQLSVIWLRGQLALSGDNLEAPGGAPFWMDFSLSFSTIVFAAGLAILAAVVAGVLPAIKATGGQMQQVLRVLGGGGSGVRLGATWTALVVAQVALSVAVLPSAIEMGWGTIRTGILGPGFAAEQYLTARVAVQAEIPERHAELTRRLQAEPGVRSVTRVAALPGAEPWAHVEVEGIPAVDTGIFEGSDLIRFNQVDEAFFDTFELPVLVGRTFGAADFSAESAVVIVNQTFARKLPGHASPLGRRIRYLDALDANLPGEQGRWYEIVGVVSTRPRNETHGTIYHASNHEQRSSVHFALHVGSTTAGGPVPFREIATALDSTLVVDELVALDAIYRDQAVGNNIGALGLGAVTLSVLLLSAAGMYALMSFTVNQRRREIGIRAALGAQPRRLLADIFRRALRQLGVGALAGILVAFLLDHYVPTEIMGGWNIPGIVPVAATVMVAIGVLSAFGPARRGLRVEPTEALRDG